MTLGALIAKIAKKNSQNISSKIGVAGTTGMGNGEIRGMLFVSIRVVASDRRRRSAASGWILTQMTHLLFIRLFSNATSQFSVD
jgi:hypothetical protein